MFAWVLFFLGFEPSELQEEISEADRMWDAWIEAAVVFELTGREIDQLYDELGKGITAADVRKFCLERGLTPNDLVVRG